MAKSDKKSKKTKSAKSEKKAAKAKAKKAPMVSPLAPPAFPDIPAIDGVMLSTAQAGVRYAGRTDLMLVDIAPGSTLAGVFTRSATRSAAVLDCQEKLGKLADKPRHGFAILVNSGNANTFTGQRGARDVDVIAAATAQAVGVPAEHVFTSSTGVIGEPLNATKITDALHDLVSGLHADAFEAAARAIMTTDTFPKGAVEQVDIGGRTVTIAGIAKGSGMIAPDMATMLAYVFTDAHVAQDGLQAMLTAATKDSFNAITVDSDTSTSDTVLLAATGRSHAVPIASGRSDRGKGVSGGPYAGDEGPRASDRARRRGGDEAGRGARHRRQIGARCRQGRAVHREFAPGQDRDRRGRSELGPHRHGRRQIGRGGGSGQADDPLRRSAGGRKGLGRRNLPRPMGRPT
jgi:glutamate N-acetyltransferase/amino-acid N-acetyltransferase